MTRHTRCGRELQLVGTGPQPGAILSWENPLLLPLSVRRAGLGQEPSLDYLYDY